MESKLEKAIAQYKSARAAAFETLKKQVQLDLQRACRKWGFNFKADWEGWYIGFTEEMSNSYRHFIDVIEPTLFNVLDMEVYGKKELGMYLDEVCIEPRDYEWVLLRASKEDVPQIEIVNEVGMNHEKYIYYGRISRQAATAIVQECSKDFITWHDCSNFLPLITKPYSYQKK